MPAECAPEEEIGVEACAWVHLDGEATRRAMKKLAGAPTVPVAFSEARFQVK